MRIVVEGLTKTYGQGEAQAGVLHDLNLVIEPGEFVAIVGTSGSGKTTLLNILGGLDNQYRGQVTIGAHALSGLGERALAGLRNRHFGFVFQSFNLLDHLNAVENVALPDFFATADKADGPRLAPKERALALLERMGLLDKQNERPPRLSGGQKQRLAIARALFNKPSIILCDEPTGSLDRKTGLQIMDLFEELNVNDSITLLVVTHEEYIARMARRVIRLEDGRVVSDTVQEPHRPEPELAIASTALQPATEEAQ
ncbi:MAG: ABC transporter ATP-binding protein [Bradymonadaceae bacterium]|nr:ABC transporter ATP-binding protein [Lujinxingiaceae bacterium]